MLVEKNKIAVLHMLPHAEICVHFFLVIFVEDKEVYVGQQIM